LSSFLSFSISIGVEPHTGQTLNSAV